jgi:hypothetical protein
MLTTHESRATRTPSRRGKCIALAFVLFACAVAAAWFVWTRHSGAAPGSLIDSSKGDAVSREEVIAIARSYAEHRWTAAASNSKHGADSHGVDMQTPDAPASASDPGKWHADAENTGMPYKWGGFDTPASFDKGVHAGKAAGDVYSYAKRRAGNAAVSAEAVGIDCSGFISRCWRLPEKFGTSSLPGLCDLLGSTDDLLPGDILNAPHGHVVLFAKWLDAGKSRALFYEAEAEPQPKVVASEHRIFWLKLRGAQPLRYRRITD